MRIFSKRFISIATVLAASTLGAQANAGAISFVGPDSVNVGDTFSIDLVVSGFENTDLGGFDVDLSYDDSLAVFSSYSLGSELTDPGFGQQDWSLGEVSPGTINLSELSYLFDFSAQPDTFTLASLSFDALEMGEIDYEFLFTDFTDGMGRTLLLDTSGGNVMVNAVPIPSTMLLLAVGLLGVGRWRQGSNHDKKSH